jgi:peroxiredoxin
VAISADSLEDSRALRERLGIGFPLLHDEGVAVAAAYGVAMKGQDLAVPTTLVVMPDRTIFWKYVGENIEDRPPEEVVFEELERALAELNAPAAAAAAEGE